MLWLSLPSAVELRQRKDRQVDPVAIQELHEIGIAAILAGGGSCISSGSCRIMRSPKRLIQSRLCLNGASVGDQVDDVKILEAVPRGIGIGARAVQDHGADAVILCGGIDDEVKHFLFGCAW